MADTENNKNSNSPALRFPGFSEPWIRQSLSELVERVTRKNTGLQSALPLTISAIYGLVDQQSFFNKIVAGENLAGYYLIKNGEFAYNKSSSSDYPWGAIKRLNNHSEGVLSTLYICFSPKSGICSDYLAQYFESNKWHNGISEIAQEGARNHGLLNVGVKDFFATKHNIPSSISEQEQIAKFLQLLDERIATQRRLIEDLEKLKSSIVDRCYRGNENIRLGEFISQVSNRNRSNCPYKVMSVSNVRGFIPQSEQFNDREIASENTTGYKIVTRDIFAYNPARINIGSIARFKGNDKGVVSPMYVCFKVEGELQPKYLEYFFQTRKFKNDVELRLEGSVRRCLNFDALCEIEIPLLTLPEQVAISSAIDTVSRKISLEGDVLTKLIIQRNYLLSKLFI